MGSDSEIFCLCVSSEKDKPVSDISPVNAMVFMFFTLICHDRVLRSLTFWSADRAFREGICKFAKFSVFTGNGNILTHINCYTDVAIVNITHTLSPSCLHRCIGFVVSPDVSTLRGGKVLQDQNPIKTDLSCNFLLAPSPAAASMLLQSTE